MDTDQTITCPWCGTSYALHRPNCKNCGGPLPAPVGEISTASRENIPEPPPAPRSFRQSYVWRRLLTDGWAIAGGIMALLGIIFALTGGIMIATVVAAFLGLPFAGLSIILLLVGLPLLVWRIQRAQQTLDVLRLGRAALGTVVDVQENTLVNINSRHPWTITYRFSVLEQEYESKTTTLRAPANEQQPGQRVYVLYLENDATKNALYPPAM